MLVKFNHIQYTPTDAALRVGAGLINFEPQPESGRIKVLIDDCHVGTLFIYKHKENETGTNSLLELLRDAVSKEIADREKIRAAEKLSSRAVEIKIRIGGEI